jgi:tetratricopeptide (TPR) repeat protein
LYLSWVLVATTSAVTLPALLTGVPVAAAQDEDAPSADEQRALDLFMQAERSYQAGRVRESLALLLEARELYFVPVLLFNIARAHETLGELEQARAGYQEYLEADPDAPDRGAIEIRIRAIDESLAERQRLEHELETAPTREPNGVNHISTVIASVGVATLGAAVVVGLTARSTRQDADAEDGQARAASTFERAKRLARVATLLYAVGGVLTAGGGTWLAIELVTADSPGGPSARLSVGVGSVTLRGTF